MARILIKAIQNGQETLAREIILKYGSCGGIDSQTSRRDGTALFFCCSRGYLELAKLLLERGASVASTDKNRATPLHAAVDNGHLDVVKLLVSHGANVNAQTYRGDTPLHLAAYRGFGEITQCLLGAGADSRLLNCNSFTAENEARGRGHQELCDYIRSVQSEHYIPEIGQHFDSMIQLDPPSLASSTNYQTNEEQNHTNNFKMDTETRHDFVVDVRKDHPHHRSDPNTRSKSCDYSNVSYNDLFGASMDLPVNILPEECANSHKKRLSQRHSAGLGSPTRLLLNTDVATFAHPLPTNMNPISPGQSNVTPSAFSGSNNPWIYSTSSGSRPMTASPQLLHPLASGYNMDAHRRPSTGSAGSCFSDFSMGTGSDTGSLPSIGSDGSGYFSDGRREDVELNDHQFVGSCVGDHRQDTDLDLLSLGVKNPPGHNHKRQLSVTSECSGFSDIYDSTLFNLSSIVSGSRKSSISDTSPVGSDFAVSGLRTSCSRQNSLGLTNDFRPRLNRAVSVNCSYPSPNITLKVRPDYTKSLSIEYRPTVAPLLERSELCPRFDRMSSNDLSTPFPKTDEPSRSMTCVNIPLN